MGKRRGVTLRRYSAADCKLDIVAWCVSCILGLTPIEFAYGPSDWLAWTRANQKQSRHFRSLPGFCLVSWRLHHKFSLVMLPQHYSIRLSQKLIFRGQKWFVCDYWGWGAGPFSKLYCFSSSLCGVSSRKGGIGVSLTSNDALLTSLFWILL
jgi:hypothetical protein